MEDDSYLKLRMKRILSDGREVKESEKSDKIFKIFGSAEKNRFLLTFE